MNDAILPNRKKLPHQPPVAVSQYATDAAFFISFCVNRRKYEIRGSDIGRRGPLVGNQAVQVLCTIQHYASIGQLRPLAAIVMPDHVHLIVMESSSASFAKTIPRIKAWVAKEQGVLWQRDFFDHRIRSEESLVEKMEYLAANPVRKQLCATPTDWPYYMRWRTW